MKKIFVFAAVILGLLAVGVIILMAFEISGRSTFLRMPWAGATLAERYTFKGDEIDAVSINLSYESVHLYVSDSDEIIVEDYRPSWDMDRKAKVTQQGASLSIEGAKNGLMFGIHYGYVNVYLPKSWNGEFYAKVVSGQVTGGENEFSFSNLQVESSSGSIHFNQVKSAEDIRLSSVSGSVNTGIVEAAGDIWLNTSSGAVRSTGATCEKLMAASISGSVTIDTVDVTTFDLDSTSGGVRIFGGSGSGKIRSTSGLIQVVLEQVNGDITASNTSGGIRISLPKASNFSFAGTTTSGSIRTPFDDSLSFDSRGKKANGNYGTGSDFAVKASTLSGSIKIDWSVQEENNR